MSKTPRTDMRAYCEGSGSLHVVPADFARQLETELNEAKETNNILALELTNEKQRCGLMMGFKDSANKKNSELKKLIKQMKETMQTCCKDCNYDCKKCDFGKAIEAARKELGE